MYYFAYGSNLCKRQMKERCPKSIYLMRATLPGFRFVYDGNSDKRKGAVGNILPSVGESVKGVIYEIDETEKVVLDKCEGVPSSYQSRIIEVLGQNGEKYHCLVYSRSGRVEGKPSEEYKNIVLEGALESGLDMDYVVRYLKK